MSNYAATVVEISNIHPHSNADRLVITNIFGNTVIVGLHTKVGDKGLYFPVESQLGLEFATVNDLIRRKDENGKPAGGMFDENRRVRCQKFRGEKSMGFFIPMDALAQTLGISLEDTIDRFPVGTDIETIGDITIASKYIPKNSKTPGAPGSKKGKKAKTSRMVDGQFHFHFDTAQLGRNMHKLNPNDIISVTWKMHGTSAIVSNCLVKRKLNIVERILQKLGIRIDELEYDIIVGSRRVIKNDSMEKEHSHFYGYDLWTEAGMTFKDLLHKGETAYYEIVGYTKDGGGIQKGFDYGCPVGKYDIYVYRITQTNADGMVTELQWPQVEARCHEMGVKSAPTIFYGHAKDFTNAVVGEHWHEDFLKYAYENYVYDQDSKFCINKVPEEGIVVRKEGADIENFKLKAFRFLEHESKELDSGEIDMETSQTEVE